MPDYVHDPNKSAHKCSNLVNAHQTAEERRGKYWLARSHGWNSYHAQAMRDFSNSALDKRLPFAPHDTPSYTKMFGIKESAL
jgi:hypothetical protein